MADAPAYGYPPKLGVDRISAALIYARLREIKEGYGVPDVVEVFE